MSTEVQPALLTIAEAAETLRCSTGTIWRMFSDGSLEPVRLRRVRGAQVRVRVAEIQRIVEPEWSRTRQRHD
jgi:excisionase family DNA binding protein